MRKLSILFLLVSLLLLTNCSTENTPIYTLSTNVNPSEAGSVTPASGEYDEGTTVEIIATPNEHWVFNGWQGDHTGIQNPVSIVMDSDKSITAQFIKREYPLTINVEGEGSVQEEVIQQKTTDYPHGTIVQLTANPAEGWEFIEWSGDVEGTEKVVEIEVDEEKNVTALFQPIDFLLTIEVEGNGHVEEEIVQPKNTEYPFSTNVQLTALPDDGWKFIEWRGDLSGNENPEIITIDREVNVTAVFEITEYSIDISIDGQGSLSIDPEKDVYREGDQVVIKVEGEGDWDFVHWEGDLDGNENPIELTITSDISATALMHQSPFEGGNGTEMYPYQVSTIEQLQEVRNYTDKHFEQINDIDASVTTTWNGGAGFKSIGDDIIPFEGTFNGRNFAINNLSINKTSHDSYIGIFGYVENGSLRNINVENVKIEALGSGVVGGLVGRLSTNSVIENVKIQGTVSGSWFVGGIAGQNFGGIIEKAFANVEVTGEIRQIGGLVGENRSFISRSVYTGNIKMVVGTYKSEKVGGLVGVNTNEIIDSYSLGSVEGYSEVGGLIGVNSNNGSILRTFTSASVNGTSDVGGLIGLNGAVAEFSYWDSTSSDQSSGVGRGSSDGVTGLSTSEMQGSSAQENMPEFDWDEVWITTSGYPILKWQVE